jgi:hypothetical protein
VLAGSRGVLAGSRGVLAGLLGLLLNALAHGAVLVLAGSLELFPSNTGR